MIELPQEVAAFFPYKDVRPFQDEFIRTVYKAVKNRSSAIVEGSNGLGKTVAVLCSCLPLAEENKLKILYVARTHRQHDRVIEELKAISIKNEVSGLSVRGRHEMCLNKFVKDNAQDSRAVMEICELLKAKNRCPYYRNIEDKRRRYFEIQRYVTSSPCSASEILRICRISRLCPYEVAKASLENATVIALSYLYVFDPSIRDAFLKSLGTPLNKIILIVDEAHNLPETAVDIASRTLTLYTVKHAEEEAKLHKHKEIAAFARILRNEIERAAEKVQKETLVRPQSLVGAVQQKSGIDNPKKFLEQIFSAGAAIRRNSLIEGRYPRSFIHMLGDFMLKWLETSEDESFIHSLCKYKSKRGLETARLEITALDPSRITEPVFSSVHSNIIVSGTLQPVEAYMRITKLPENTVQKAVPAPFPKEHILPLICCDVTTAMDKRTSAMYRVIVEHIQEVVQNTPANIGVFTASFQILEALRDNGIEGELPKRVFCEHRGMSSKENENMVEEFKAYSRRGGAVLLGTQGGRTSEGVDFPGDQMNSVVIVGVPYSEPTPKMKAQIDYFERCFPGRGREYGYVIPAMKKASQAAGRPIRTLEDRAAMIFLDYRFSLPYCKQFFPSWIRDNIRILPNQRGSIAKELQQFFRKAS